jgi:hypothetical protein
LIAAVPGFEQAYFDPYLLGGQHLIGAPVGDLVGQPGNRTLYTRLGFVESGPPVQLPGGPTL